MAVIDLKKRRPPEGSGQAAETRVQGQDNTTRSLIGELISAAEKAELWHTPDGEGWASVAGQNYRILSPQFRHWLVERTYSRCGRVPPERTLADALRLIAAQAIYRGSERVVHLRVAEHKNAVYLDLADAKGRAVRITADKWVVVPAFAVPIKFHRPPGVRPLPEPSPSEGSEVSALSELRALLNLGSENDFRLLLTAMTAALRPRGPYPVLVINGEQGSAKSGLTRLIRALVDPNAVPFSGPPKNEGDLVARARNHHVVAFDNVSALKPDLADSLCRLATGGGLGGRKLYTDADEAVFEAQRPVILNGIPELAWRGDLADRAITFTLPPIEKGKHLSEEVLGERFEAARPAILGQLLDAMVAGMRRLPEVGARARRGELSLPRMADFAVWGMAVAPAFGWTEDAFLAAYEQNRKAGQLAVLEGDPLADALIRLVEGKGEWEGTATSLLKKLNSTNPSIRCFRGWPRSPASLGTTIQRLKPLLGAVGIQVEADRSSAKRSIRLYKKDR